MAHPSDEYFEEWRKERDRKLKQEQWKKYEYKPESRHIPSPKPSSDFNADVSAIAAEAAALLIKKHQDYGPDNINNAPGGAMNGLIVRLHDKMERLKTLITGNKTPKYESIEDTLIDMLNYALIGLMVQRGKWPKK